MWPQRRYSRKRNDIFRVQKPRLTRLANNTGWDFTGFPAKISFSLPAQRETTYFNTSRMQDRHYCSEIWSPESNYSKCENFNQSQDEATDTKNDYLVDRTAQSYHYSTENVHSVCNSQRSPLKEITMFCGQPSFKRHIPEKQENYGFHGSGDVIMKKEPSNFYCVTEDRCHLKNKKKFSYNSPSVTSNSCSYTDSLYSNTSSNFFKIPKETQINLRESVKKFPKFFNFPLTLVENNQSFGNADWHPVKQIKTKPNSTFLAKTPQAKSESVFGDVDWCPRKQIKTEQSSPFLDESPKTRRKSVSSPDFVYEGKSLHKEQTDNQPDRFTTPPMLSSECDLFPEGTKCRENQLFFSDLDEEYRKMRCLHRNKRVTHNFFQQYRD